MKLSQPLPILLAALLTTSTNARPAITGPPAPCNYIAKDKTERTIHRRETGGVKICSGAQYTGSCWSGAWPLNECVALNDYAGHILSFQPDADNECYLMQGHCNSNKDFADLLNDGTTDADLSVYPWIANATSYLCLTPLQVEVQRHGAIGR